ncbi:glycosyl hydrolase [uncultured Draconibacterium sp.]|uniref:glycosyl hydrolase n=1 Tax=uncultured Draconibacterium sp. TaxID=1573823 RepID=UPI0025E9B789|nr:glycosyl hydrolase [uncultured Draconibacterium sp.]
MISCSKNNTGSSELYEQFKKPGKEARPRVWWHWMNGNVTKDGIQKDLLWMKRSGIGGFQNFDAGMMMPQVVEKRLTYMTPEWKDAFRYATHLADSLDLEMAIAGSPGWSQTGGPWVPAKDGMKKLVWRDIRVIGGHKFEGELPEPYTNSGTFQNISLADDATAFTSDGEQAQEYYDDIAVIAYKLPVKDINLAELNPEVTSSGGRFSLAQLTDGDLAKTNLLPVYQKGDYGWIQFKFNQSQTVKSITLVGGGLRDQWGAVPPANTRNLQVSEDGVVFRDLCQLPLGGVAQQTINIPETTSRYFRINFKNPTSSPYASIEALFGGQVSEVKGTEIAEIVLHPVTRINHTEEKAGFAAAFDLEENPTPATSDVVDLNTVINLTDKVDENGVLQWDVPDGAWKIVRFGYSLTGKINHPASPEATGLEVDKIDARAVRDYFNNYLDQYKDATGGLMGDKGLEYIITDSYEAGQMTWTPAMEQEFATRRGYSLLPWMPVLTGQIIKSTEASEQFLWDWRKTIGEMIAEFHYDQLTDILDERGMSRYTESHENGRLYLVDGMDAKRKAAVPMSAMWISSGAGSTPEMAQADIRESASVAHIYGQNLVAAESLTAMGLMGNAWSYCPENLKATADMELANGLNRFVIHTSVHQPIDDKIPGLGLMIFGQWFNRHETWAEQAKAWTDYLARSSYLLQQGQFVADIVYYYGEDNNITGLFGHQLPAIPNGYNFDFINTDALNNLLEVKDGNLVTPSGMNYKILVLDENCKRMSLAVLRKLNKLACEGAVIVGKRPEFKAGLQGDNEEFNRLVNDVWNSGKVNVRESESMEQVLNSLSIKPDFTYTSDDKVELLNVHRKVGDADIYWVNSRSGQSETVNATFRVTGKKPEIWHPETGDKEDASFVIEKGTTTVKLDLSPNDAVFVVFGEPSKVNKVELPEKQEKEVHAVEGQWNVVFQSGRGAPAYSTFNKLESYTENSNEGIKYFSGTASYTKTIQLSAIDLSVGKLYLDLGEVKNLAQVTLNGVDLGVVWKKPFTLDISGAVKTGENKLEVKVVNLWVNRLIGDTQPDVKEKITYTTMPFYQSQSPLQPSGLLGPVSIVSVMNQ